MNHNIFSRMMQQKFNPDVAQNYQQAMATRQAKYEPDQRVWKGITDQQVTGPVRRPEDLKLRDEDAPSAAVLTQRLEEQLAARSVASVRPQQAPQQAPHQAPHPPHDPSVTRDHQEMKAYAIRENDRLQEEKARYNRLLQELDGIL
jgi:hypothetical protein